ncbi:HEAT repeat domain-containing protein [Pedobacter sp. 22226]|uniref:HEAT repeat domain-containing protein n=1 Tax=Pedobacter sp. 22226 TaxID=3453894 RepID=UPI003F8497C0
MAFSYNLNTEKAISFDDFINDINGIIKPNNDQSLIDCVESLQMLSNNRSFLSEYLHRGLEEFATFQEDNRYNCDIFIMHKHPLYLIRCVLWNGQPEEVQRQKKQEDIYHTLRAHDHNFSFLTVGYLNNGYETDIWEYDNDRVIGYIGEKVDLKYLERTNLQQGKAMLYRASKDIHAQHPPMEQSVSLNIMYNDPGMINQEQYYFDVKNGIIDSHVSAAGSGRHLILELAKIYGDSRSIDLVEQIATKHKYPHIRIKAYDTLGHITNEKQSIWTSLVNDPDRVVSGYARQFLNQA